MQRFPKVLSHLPAAASHHVSAEVWPLSNIHGVCTRDMKLYELYLHCSVFFFFPEHSPPKIADHPFLAKSDLHITTEQRDNANISLTMNICLAMMSIYSVGIHRWWISAKFHKPKKDKAIKPNIEEHGVTKTTAALQLENAQADASPVLNLVWTQFWIHCNQLSRVVKQFHPEATAILSSWRLGILGSGLALSDSTSDLAIGRIENPPWYNLSRAESRSSFKGQFEAQGWRSR